MPEKDTLLTIAQIAATFVGFSTLVIAFRDKATKHNRYIFKEVAAIGIGTMVAALLPIFINGFTNSPDLVWRLSSGLFAAIWIIGLTTDIRELLAAGLPATLTGSWFSADTVLNAVGIPILMFNAIKITDYAATLYIIGITCSLLICGLSFITATFRVGEPDT